MSIERGGGGVVVSLCRHPSSLVGLDGGQLVSFVGIRPFCVMGSRRLWLGWALYSLVGLVCGRFCGGGGCLTLYGDGVVIG